MRYRVNFDSPSFNVCFTVLNSQCFSSLSLYENHLADLSTVNFKSTLLLSE